MFQICFDTSTAVAAAASRGRIKATNTARNGGRTRITAGIARGQNYAARSAPKNFADVRRGAAKAFKKVALPPGAGLVASGIDGVVSGAAKRNRNRKRTPSDPGSGPAPPLRRQDASVGTGASIDNDEQDVQEMIHVSLDPTIDERLLSPQQRRALMRSRLGIASAQTGAFRGFANRVLALAQRAVNMGVVPSPTSDHAQRHKLLGNDDDDDDDKATDPFAYDQETAPGTESDDEEQRRGAAVASGHGTAYDELARRIAAASSSSA